MLLKKVYSDGVPNTVNETIYPTWFIINLDGCCTESFNPVDCKQSYWWFGRPHSSFGAIIRRIRKWNHVIEYLVSENINVLISYCLKENEIRPLRWATAICVFKLLRRKIDKWGKTPLPEQDCAHSFSQHESYNKQHDFIVREKCISPRVPTPWLNFTQLL